MRTIDETDREILRLLLSDARRPYSDIADRVGLSAPAVSDRVDRLRELGVLESFTVTLDRSMLTEGARLLVTVTLSPRADPDVERVSGHDRVEHAFLTASGDLVFVAVVSEGDVRPLVAELLGEQGERIRELDVELLAGSSWSPTLGDADLAVECVECGNTVTSEGESARIDGTLYHFCCGSCLANFEERYERLQEGA
ncbi:MAG: AsnC family transcriptional regulator [Haloferacaceae archaeon]